MKIELIEEILPDGVSRYSTEKDGRYVENSVTRNKEEAMEFYRKIVEFKGTLKRVI